MSNEFTVIAYKLIFTNSEMDAIYFHGYRYQVSDFIIRHTSVIDEEDPKSSWLLELSESESWSLREFWNDEGPLSCGSAQLNSKIQTFIDSII